MRSQQSRQICFTGTVLLYDAINQPNDMPDCSRSIHPRTGTPYPKRRARVDAAARCCFDGCDALLAPNTSHNAAPLVPGGRCCDECNLRVLAHRLVLAGIPLEAVADVVAQVVASRDTHTRG